MKILSDEIYYRVKEIDWEFSEDDTQFLTHNIHRYSGKFIPQIAENVIKLLSDENDKILDPYMGSGTTLLEAAYLNRYSVGVDLNPLAVLISKVKVTPICSDNLKKLLCFFEEFCDKLNSYFADDLFNTDATIHKYMETKVLTDIRNNCEWYNRWYEKKSLLKLLAIEIKINSLKDESLKNLSLVAFSEIVRKSSNAHSGFPNVMYDKNWNLKKKKNPIDDFFNSLVNIVNSVKSLDETILEKYQPKTILSDNRTLNIQSETIDSIITHPPYIAAVPYAEYGSLSLKWLGFEPKELDAKLTGGKRGSKYVVDNFEKGYAEFFNESYRVLKDGKYMFIMVANPTVKGRIVDLKEMSERLASKAGFELIVDTVRKGKNRRANKMNEEYLLFFKK